MWWKANDKRRKMDTHKLIQIIIIIHKLLRNIRHLTFDIYLESTCGEHWTQSKFLFLYFVVQNMHETIEKFHRKKAVNLRWIWTSKLSGCSIQYFHTISAGILSRAHFILFVNYGSGSSSDSCSCCKIYSIPSYILINRIRYKKP